MRRRASFLAELAAVTAILALAGWLRWASLDRFIASDEVRWTCRSTNFQTALRERDWHRTFQVGHPGVVTMWLGALALPRELGRWPELCQTTKGGSDLSHLDDQSMAGVLQTIVPLLVAARHGVAIGTWLLLILVYCALRRGLRLPPWPAIAGLAMVALDPFLTAHSRVLHLDALTALLTLLAVLLATVGPRLGWRAVALSGMAGGLAMANKSAAGVLVLVLPPLLAWSGWRNGRWLRACLLWGAAAILAVIAIWPAMWVEPFGTVARVLGKASQEGLAPHESGNYFLGRPVADPGPAFYPLAAAFRLTPLACLGLLAAIALAVGELRPRPGQEREWIDGTSVASAQRLVTAVLAWAMAFLLAITLGPKKFDRYLLPALVAANLSAGVALGAMAHRMGTDGRMMRETVWPKWRSPHTRRGTIVGAGVLSLMMTGQALSALYAHPYALTYYNPLLGGARVAAKVLLVGWGEGYDLAARWLNQQPGAEQLEVAVRGVANFAPLFRGRTRSAEGYRAASTDYVVFYISQMQRRQNADLIAQYQRPGQAPVWVGRLAGLPYVWIYANWTLIPLRHFFAGRLEAGDVVVAGGESVFARRYDYQAPLVRFWGHWSPEEMWQAYRHDFPEHWHRAWVVRYPHEPDVAAIVLGQVAQPVASYQLADQAIEIRLFARSGP